MVSASVHSELVQPQNNLTDMDLSAIENLHNLKIKDAVSLSLFMPLIKICVCG